MPQMHLVTKVSPRMYGERRNDWDNVEVARVMAKRQKSRQPDGECLILWGLIYRLAFCHSSSDKLAVQ